MDRDSDELFGPSLKDMSLTRFENDIFAGVVCLLVDVVWRPAPVK